MEFAQRAAVKAAQREKHLSPLKCCWESPALLTCCYISVSSILAPSYPWYQPALGSILGALSLSLGVEQGQETVSRRGQQRDGSGTDGRSYQLEKKQKIAAGVAQPCARHPFRHPAPPFQAVLAVTRAKEPRTCPELPGKPTTRTWKGSGLRHSSGDGLIRDNFLLCGEIWPQNSAEITLVILITKQRRCMCLMAHPKGI